MSATSVAADATGSIEIAASPDDVYRLLTDLDRFASVTEETTTMRWTGGATGAAPGASFSGANRNGWRRWSTASIVTDADAGRRFAFEVTAPAGITVARWQYDLEPTATGCRVTESTWDRRPAWFVKPAGMITGVSDRTSGNAANIEATLTRLKAALES
ncbi:SRPBCC family protein [Nocardioides sp. R-C-SC26]|uniref:SRPBCC family protein n=1 Tax=Nocardioides sp. R-C-SC26 TaxID=2870414 RepID=UPI001E4293EB|nr:SRPBCC family protein [Nocardioides sp. R-C-SC26]